MKAPAEVASELQPIDPNNTYTIIEPILLKTLAGNPCRSVNYWNFSDEIRLSFFFKTTNRQHHSIYFDRNIRNWWENGKQWNKKDPFSSE